MMNGPMQTPDELDLLEFFESEPVECTPTDGYWCYQVTDQRGVTLRFSFDKYQRSVQTVVSAGGTPVATVVQEGAELMRVAGDQLTCDFAYRGGKATLAVTLGAALSIHWSSLQTA